MKVTVYETNKTTGHAVKRTAYLATRKKLGADFFHLINRTQADKMGYHNPDPGKAVFLFVTEGILEIAFWNDAGTMEERSTHRAGDVLLFLDWEEQVGPKERRGHRSSPGVNGNSQANIVAEAADILPLLFATEAEALAAT